MKRSGRVVLAMPALALVLASCGRDGPALYPVYGKVTYKGQPAAGAAVHFRRDGDTSPEGVSFPIGVVDEAGEFQLEMSGIGDGAPAGKYKVLIIWSEDAPRPSAAAKAAPRASKSSRPATVVVASADRNGSKSVADRLHYRYFNLEKPLLEAEVRAETKRLEPFELKD